MTDRSYKTIATHKHLPKALWEIICTSLTHKVVALVTRAENGDYFDTHPNFTRFYSKPNCKTGIDTVRVWRSSPLDPSYLQWHTHSTPLSPYCPN